MWRTHLATEKRTKTATKDRDYGDGSVYFVEKLNVWIGAYVAGKKPNGKLDRRTVRGKTEEEARRKLKKLMDECKRTDYVYVQRDSFATYITHWLTTVKRLVLKERSYDRLEQTINHDVIPHIGNIQLAALSTDDIQTMIAELKDEGRGYSTIKKAYDAVCCQPVEKDDHETAHGQFYPPPVEYYYQEDRLLTAKDLQYILSIGKNRAYELMNSRAFPTLQIGCRKYVSRAALRKWVETYTGREYLI